MISYEDSLKILKETNALIDGHFILSSGLHSSQYVQCAQLLSKPEKAKIICESLAGKINDTFKNIDIIFSPTIFCERVENKFLLRRNFSIPKNSNVLIVEDVITTGKSSLECSNIIKKNEANILGYACIIDRSNNKSLIKDKIISQIKIDIPTFNKENIPKELSKIKAVKPGSRNI